MVSIRDESLSEWLQIESNLTLEKAKKFIRQRETIQQQQSILKGNKDTQNDTLGAMYMKRKVMSGKVPKRVSTNPVTAPAQTKICRRCGKNSHPRQLCPANNVVCFRCNRKGHFSSQCLSKTMGEMTTYTPPYQKTDSDIPDDDPYSDTVFLSADAVYVDAVNKTNSSQWNITVTV